MTSCVGYSYGRLCYLYPSYKRQCPPRWREERYGHVALTGNDLVHEGVGGARYCKVKQGTLQRISGGVYIRMIWTSNILALYSFKLTKKIILGPAKVHGAWSSWSSYSSCSVSCGSGSKTRTRECNSPPPSGGGSYCSGRSSQTATCEEKECRGTFVSYICTTTYVEYIL